MAILLVLVQHFSPLEWTIAHRIGWTGVDLFFVLSGYLVTTLLLTEFQKRGTTDVKRFLIRRGFKIYPAFWVMTLSTCLMLALKHQPISLKAVGAELLFLQNYGPGLWVHTWSLAVEEHFYFALAGLFWWWTARKRRQLPSLKQVLLGLAGISLAVLALRLTGMWRFSAAYKFHKFGTHARIDTLFVGATLAFVRHRHLSELSGWVKSHQKLLWSVLLLLVLVMAFDESSLFIRTVGYWCCAVAYASLLALALQSSPTSARRFKWAAAIGQYSYGIYLWHFFLSEFVVLPLLNSTLSAVGLFFVQSAVSIVGGVLLSKAIEMPFLKLRDRLVPTASVRPSQ